MSNFLDIMDKAKEFPLPIHFLFTSIGKTVHGFIISDVGENWFNDTHSFRVFLFGLRGINAVSHFCTKLTVV